MNAHQPLPKLDDLPIPADVRPGKGWSPLMVEMADHIGAFATLQLLDRFGGEYVYFPIDPAKSKFVEAVGDEKATILSRIYGGERMELPLGQFALRRARRAALLAAIRKGTLTAADGARIMGTRRTTIRKMMAAQEGHDAEPFSIARHRRDPGQMDMFGEE